MSREVIAVDIDDVLSDTAEGFTAFSNERYGTSLTISDFTEHWADMWQVDNDEVTRRAAEYHESGAANDFQHKEEALPVLRELEQSYKLLAITSRSNELKSLTHEWVERHFGEIFDDIKFAGIFDGPIHDGLLHRTKGELFASNAVNYVIDDHLKHCFAAAKLGIQSVLFGDYPWNQHEDLPPEIIRCENWGAVAEFFDARG